jgi:hypothetical protein
MLSSRRLAEVAFAKLFRFDQVPSTNCKCRGCVPQRLFASKIEACFREYFTLAVSIFRHMA